MNSPVDGVGSGAILGAFRPAPWLSICVDRSEAKPDCIGRLRFGERPGCKDKVRGGEGVARSDVSEAYQGVHQRQLS